MKKFIALLSIPLLLLSAQTQAAIIGFSGDAQHISPVSVQEDSPTNTLQQGFDEKQNVWLTSAVNVDGGSIAAGQHVNSHLVFLNSYENARINTTAKWTFDGDILGVMSNTNGSLLMGSDGLFASFTDYFTVGNLTGAFNTQGLEGGDVYSVTGNLLNLTMTVSEPGDWIRVITATPSVSAVPIPAAFFLFAPALLGFLGLRRKA